MRVAMLLDNAGSMAQDGKMSAMPTAAKNLVDQLSGLVLLAGGLDAQNRWWYSNASHAAEEAARRRQGERHRRVLSGDVGESDRVGLPPVRRCRSCAWRAEPDLCRDKKKPG